MEDWRGKRLFGSVGGRRPAPFGDLDVGLEGRASGDQAVGLMHRVKWSRVGVPLAFQGIGTLMAGGGCTFLTWLLVRSERSERSTRERPSARSRPIRDGDRPPQRLSFTV